MSNFDFENFSEGDWDDRGDLVWNEFDWEQYLRVQDQGIQNYMKLYRENRDRADRLNHLAFLMGWDVNEWTAMDPLIDEGDTADAFGEDLDARAAEEDELDDSLDPYTLHRHPVFIATKALYLFLQEEWQRLLGPCQEILQPKLSGAYQQTLHNGENNAVFAIHALDMGDYALSVCQFKRALSHLNRSFFFLEKIIMTNSPLIRDYHKEALVRLFDLREVWLRVMQYSREEVDRRFNDDE